MRQGELTRRRREFGWWPELQEAVGKATKRRRRYGIGWSRTHDGQTAQDHGLPGTFGAKGCRGADHFSGFEATPTKEPG